MAIDTLGYSNYLEEHGMPRDQAKAHATAANQFLFPQLVTLPNLGLPLSEQKIWLIMATAAIVGVMNATLFALIKPA
jgi:hypothetical protein